MKTKDTILSGYFELLLYQILTVPLLFLLWFVLYEYLFPSEKAGYMLVKTWTYSFSLFQIIYVAPMIYYWKKRGGLQKVKGIWIGAWAYAGLNGVWLIFVTAIR
uniref:Uncharacterized protein n=1 Tax=Magnetococcus massalia (strain MO-1) TaxID=451514 RepID=A0A1S7LQ23_MAGMO|nr:Membrane protein of unknown function [Candidatus Magnetococcus massalia]